MSAIRAADDRRTQDTRLADWWNRTRYHLYAPIYDWVARPLERGRKRAIERAAPKASDRILLVGSGPGSDLPHLPNGASITAIDAAPGMVRRTKNRANVLALDVDARIGDGQNLPFADDSFDLVLLHLILSVVPDPAAVASETARVVRSAGRVSIYDKFIPEGTNPSFLRSALNPLTRFFFSDITRQLAPMFAATDLEIQDRESALGGLYTITTAHPRQALCLGRGEILYIRTSERRPRETQKRPNARGSIHRPEEGD